MRYGSLLFVAGIAGIFYLVMVFFPAYQAQQQNCNGYAAQVDMGYHAALASWISQDCECYGGNHPYHTENMTVNYDPCQ